MIDLPIKPHAPGIYFGLPEADYHADPSVSTSAIKKLLEGCEQYWHESWMNPYAPAREQKDCLSRGTLWHCRLLEPEQFDEKYIKAPALGELVLEGYEVLETIGQMRKWMERNGFQGFKKTGSHADYVEAVKTAIQLIPNPDTRPYLLTTERDELLDRNPDATVIWSEEIWTEMLQAEAALQAHPYFCKVFQGGMSEVSIFWIDEASGIPMKARIDKLKPRAILDYKTLHVPRGKGVLKAALNAIKFEKYDLQAAVYTIAVGQAVKMINEATGVIWGDVPGDFIDEFRKQPEKPFGLIFQQEVAPYAVRGRTITRHGGDLLNCFGNGLYLMQQGIEVWRSNWELYGVKRWIDTEGLIEVQDNEIYIGGM